MENITVEAIVYAPIGTVWESYTQPAHIVKWNAASEDWHTPEAENDLRVGGRFRSRMEAKEGDEGFDFTGAYTDVVPHERIAYVMDDGRHVEVRFVEEGGGTRLTITFDPETVNAPDFQRAGWQAILDNFKRYTESIV